MLESVRLPAFAQLTWRESWRDSEACLNSRHHPLYHLGLRGPGHRTTLADANEQRDWRGYADLAQSLLRQARAHAVGGRAVRLRTGGHRPQAGQK